MNWFALAQLLFRVFGPVLAEWLRSLLDVTDEPQLGPCPGETAEAIRTWFAAAHARTAWYQLWSRRRLAALERAALSMSGEIAATLRFNAADPVLSPAAAKLLAESL